MGERGQDRDHRERTEFGGVILAEVSQDDAEGPLRDVADRSGADQQVAAAEPGGFVLGRSDVRPLEVPRDSTIEHPGIDGEADRHARYILREDALELGEDGWTSNIGADRAEIVAFWRALEQVERLNRKNANVYISIILPLPHQLSAEERSDLVDSITAPLTARGLPFVAAQHLPDEGGDQRNYHLHLQMSCRPMKRVRPYEWDFSAPTQAAINSPIGIRMMRRSSWRE